MDDEVSLGGNVDDVIVVKESVARHVYPSVPQFTVTTDMLRKVLGKLKKGKRGHLMELQQNSTRHYQKGQWRSWLIN